MKKKYIYILGLLIVAILGYNSVFFKKLSIVKKEQKENFDFKAFADSIYYKGILKSTKTIDLTNLIASVKSDRETAFKNYGNRLGIGNSAYFMIQSTGKIIAIKDGVYTIADEKNGIVYIDTKYIFGNALRDASGLVKLTDFKTNAQFNKVSESLNDIVRNEVIPNEIKKVHIGDSISFSGAIKLSKKQTLFTDLLIIPSQIKPQ
jgi:predicted lipoprotein